MGTYYKPSPRTLTLSFVPNLISLVLSTNILNMNGYISIENQGKAMFRKHDLQVGACKICGF